MMAALSHGALRAIATSGSAGSRSNAQRGGESIDGGVRGREPGIVDGGPAGLDAELALGTDEVSRHAVRLVVVDGGPPRLERFAALPRLLRAGDLIVVNDAATLPASLPGRTADGAVFELRLSGVIDERSESGGRGPAGSAGGEGAHPLSIDAGRLFGVMLGAGDHRTRTEHRAAPPRVAEGERVTIAGLAATVARAAGRRVELVVLGDGDQLWQALYAAGAPVQYAHRVERLPLWSVQTAYAGRPWAAEMPSAGRPLLWETLLELRRAGTGVASLTHAAGLPATGDDALDRALPWPERYEIPRRTVEAVGATRARGGRVIAIGTTVVRALEAAASSGELRPGSGIATLRLDAAYRPRIVAGLVSGLHVPGESHFELLSAFAPVERLRGAIALAARHGLSSHELGDACLIVPG